MSKLSKSELAIIDLIIAQQEDKPVNADFISASISVGSEVAVEKAFDVDVDASASVFGLERVPTENLKAMFKSIPAGKLSLNELKKLRKKYA
ncbi:hypothetical protein KFE98_01175 [bacterium SCSIO 12741]|nr:hypothetical protein KFE98_01175 [bacterium SCSIO 12741]